VAGLLAWLSSPATCLPTDIFYTTCHIILFVAGMAAEDHAARAGEPVERAGGAILRRWDRDRAKQRRGGLKRSLGTASNAHYRLSRVGGARAWLRRGRESGGILATSCLAADGRGCKTAALTTNATARYLLLGWRSPLQMTDDVTTILFGAVNVRTGGW